MTIPKELRLNIKELRDIITKTKELRQNMKKLREDMNSNADYFIKELENIRRNKKKKRKFICRDTD